MSQSTLQKPGNKERVSEIAESKKSRMYRLIILYILFPYFCTYFIFVFTPYFGLCLPVGNSEVGIRCDLFKGNTQHGRGTPEAERSREITKKWTA